jgi:hypothetical protein
MTKSEQSKQKKVGFGLGDTYLIVYNVILAIG